MKVAFFIFLALSVCAVGKGANLAPTPSMCTLPTDPGASCRDVHPVKGAPVGAPVGAAVKGVQAGDDDLYFRYTYDTSKGQCEPFTYYGCGGNANNFGTKTDCRKTCENKYNGLL